jgi:hypothetical protein
MMKRFLVLSILLLGAGSVLAQDMPPLPPLPGDSNAPAASNNAAPLPPLPGNQTAPAANNNLPALPPLPGDKGTPSGNNNAPVLPPLPGQAAATPTPNNSAPASQQAPAPVLPQGTDQGQATTVTETPVETPGAAPVSETAPKKKHAAGFKWHEPTPQPNVIYGGWVTPKGGNESARLSWVSQEILNTFDFKGYKTAKPEEGLYQGEKGSQWRLFSFYPPKSKLTVQVYIRQAGKKVWVRVGPSEPPAGEKLKTVLKMRKQNLEALNLLKKHFKGRLVPHRYISSWDAPYRRPQNTPDE